MPTDKTGRFHLGIQRAMAADKNPELHAAPKAPAPSGPERAKEPGRSPDENQGASEGESTTLHAHGDGTFHTEGHDGEHTEHPDIGHALMHLAAKHGDGGKHMHVHSDGMSHTTHHVGEDGQVEGPHDHPDIESTKEHMGQVMGDNDSDDWETQPKEKTYDDY